MKSEIFFAPLLGYVFNDGSYLYNIRISKEANRLLIETPKITPGPRDRNRVFPLPLRASIWIYESIANGFWRSPEQGGFAKGLYHCEQEFDGEKIRINRMMNVGAPDQKGFMITNLSKMDPDLEMPMEIQIPDVMLIEGGLLEVFRNAQEGVAN